MAEFTGSEAGLHSVESAMGDAQEKLAHVKQQAQDGLARFKDQAEGFQAQARDQLQRVDGSVQSFARQNPLAAVAGAVVAGFIIGRLASKI